MHSGKILEIIDWRAQNSKILILVNILLGVVLFIFILICVRDIIAQVYKKEDVKQAVLSQSATSKYGKKKFQEYEVILRNNPFGFQAGSLKPMIESSDKASSGVGMKLIGTISGNALHSYAVFIGHGGKQEIFKIGDAVFGRGLLKRVEKDKVFIEEGGLLTQIRMADFIVTDKDNGTPGVGFPDYVKSLGKGEYIIDQKTLQQALDNPKQIMTDARVVPNIVNNKQEGFIMREVKKGGIYDRIGLKNEDTLLRINDYYISNHGDALQAFTALRGMDRVRFDIIRSGTKTTLNYQIR